MGEQRYLTPEEVAAGLKVKATDIVNWIKEGKIKATEKENGEYLVAAEDYQEFGSTMPKELFSKVSEYLWESYIEAMPLAQKKVCERFSQNIQPVLDRDEDAIGILESLHSEYEPLVDIFEDKRGIVASFILYARVISLLYSIAHLLRVGIPSESLILLRPLFEAILLAEYFAISDANNENDDKINKWFDNNYSPKPAVVRKYISSNWGIREESLKDMHNRLSKQIHHTYKSIMESYRGVSMSGPFEERSIRLGFDYHQSSIMRDVIDIISGFEEMLLSALLGFIICFKSMLTDEEINLIKSEIGFYKLDQSKRLEIIFKEE